VQATINRTSSRLESAVDTIAVRCAALERQLDEAIDVVGGTVRDRYSRPES
jgi:hypothetical protein